MLPTKLIAVDAPSDPPPPSTPRAWFELLYHELRRRARGELFRHQALTLGATTLLHEAWLRLDGKALEFRSQPELVAYAGQVMRGIVIDHVRSRSAQKHGGAYELVPYETGQGLGAMPDDEILQLDDALKQLATTDPALAELVDLHFFAGLSFIEVAALRGVSDRTVQRDWQKARTLLYGALRP